MKKTLIAIAALAATGAFAQSSVQIDGVADAGLVSLDYKGQKVTGIAQNLSSTSQINVRGTSDLGGGLKAIFRVETDLSFTTNAANQGGAGNLNPASSAAAATAAAGQAGYVAPVAANGKLTTNGAGGTFGNGELFVGLDGGFGKIRFGAINNLGLDHVVTSQPFGTAIGSGYAETVIATPFSTPAAAAVRNDNTLRFDTANYGGFTGTYLARKQQTSTAASGATIFPNGTYGAQQQSSVSQLGLAYNAGPLNVLVSRMTEDGLNTNNVFVTTTGTFGTVSGQKGTLTNLAANYNMGALTLMAGYQGLSASNTAGAKVRETSNMNFAAKYVMGVNTFAANYGRLNASKVLDATGAAQDVSLSASLIGLGYEYALSKTTAVVARYESVKDDAASLVGNPTGIAGATGTARTRMGFGIRTAF
jgi:predicted porin